MLEEIHAASLLNLVNANRLYLREWLPWVDYMLIVENSKNYINDCKRRASEKSDFSFGIIINKDIVGRIGLHHVNYQNRIAEIGYWLADGMQGSGIMNRCCKAIINHAFKELGINRIEIKCGTGNTRSLAIPEKLQFKQEGILRQAELLNGKFIDLYLYAMLKEEWQG